jgi:hypothetical protein
MVLTNRYVKSLGNSLIGSYDYQDLVKGVGYIEFFGVMVATSSTTSGALVTKPIWCKALDHAQIAGSENYITNATLNYDIEISQKLVTQGMAFITIPAFFYYNSGGSGQLRGTFNASVYKLVDGTETLISDVASGSILSVSLSTGQYDAGVWSGVVNVTKTVLKKTNKLRLKIVGSGVSAPNALGLFNDPMNNTYSTPTVVETTQLKLDLPFRINGTA